MNIDRVREALDEMYEDACDCLTMFTSFMDRMSDERRRDEVSYLKRLSDDELASTIQNRLHDDDREVNYQYLNSL